jgi:hypothetical protein
MSRIICTLACLACFTPALWAAADEAPSQPNSEEQWLLDLRNSASYKKGMETMHADVDLAYDRGAIRGAKHWEMVHRYYLDLAVANGCKDSMQFAEGPLRSCEKVPRTKPTLRGPDYQEGQKEVAALAHDTRRPAGVHSVLLSIFDYGYVQGLRHGLRAHNDDLEWKEAYYKACITRANEAEAEPMCAERSKIWSAAVLAKIKKQIESFGLVEKQKID